MIRILPLALILFVFACSKEHGKNRSPSLPEKLTENYNDSTYCNAEGCKAYIQLITYQSENYFALAYDPEPLCDMALILLPIYNENGEEIDKNSELYKNVSTKGHRGNRIWHCSVIYKPFAFNPVLEIWE